MLTSSPFRSSRQCQELLKYIVDRSLSGHSELLKERVIGIEVFGRRPDYDTGSDPIVRARGAELRKRLALYYQTGHTQSVRICVPQGSFRATFERLETGSVPPPPLGLHEGALHEDPAEPIAPLLSRNAPQADGQHFPFRFRFGARWIIALVVALLAIILMVRLNLFSPEMRVYARFWSPILESSYPALIYVGGNAVYQLSPTYLAEYYKQHPQSQTEQMGLESYIPWPPGSKLDAQDLYPAKDTFVTIGDLAAISKIEVLLVRRNRQFDIRYGQDVSYGDLRQSPTILIGAHNNSWTLTMTGNLRYAFSGPNAIVDRFAPQKRWSTNDSFSDDYAIVSRLVNVKSGSKVFTVAGIGYAGTQTAADFLTNPRSIAELVRSLPRGWESRNLQVVLHTTVTDRIPNPPDVVAKYCW